MYKHYKHTLSKKGIEIRDNKGKNEGRISNYIKNIIGIK